jgi:hypothetical protein
MDQTSQVEGINLFNLSNNAEIHKFAIDSIINMPIFIPSNFSCELYGINNGIIDIPTSSSQKGPFSSAIVISQLKSDDLNNANIKIHDLKINSSTLSNSLCLDSAFDGNLEIQDNSFNNLNEDSTLQKANVTNIMFFCEIHQNASIVIKNNDFFIGSVSADQSRCIDFYDNVYANLINIENNLLCSFALLDSSLIQFDANANISQSKIIIKNNSGVSNNSQIATAINFKQGFKSEVDVINNIFNTQAGKDSSCVSISSVIVDGKLNVTSNLFNAYSNGNIASSNAISINASNFQNSLSINMSNNYIASILQGENSASAHGLTYNVGEDVSNMQCITNNYYFCRSINTASQSIPVSFNNEVSFELNGVAYISAPTTPASNSTNDKINYFNNMTTVIKKEEVVLDTTTPLILQIYSSDNDDSKAYISSIMSEILKDNSILLINVLSSDD